MSISIIFSCFPGLELPRRESRSEINFVFAISIDFESPQSSSNPPSVLRQPSPTLLQSFSSINNLSEIYPSPLLLQTFPTPSPILLQPSPSPPPVLQFSSGPTPILPILRHFRLIFFRLINQSEIYRTCIDASFSNPSPLLLHCCPTSSPIFLQPSSRPSPVLQ